MGETTDRAPVEPLSDDRLHQLRVLLDRNVNCIEARTVAALIARHDDAHGEIGALQGEILKAHGAIQAVLRRAVAAETDRDQLRRQLDAAEAAPPTVWWLEGDHDENDPTVHATLDAAKTAGITVFRRLNDDAEFPDRAFDWEPVPDFDGYTELLVHDTHTGITVREITVQGATDTTQEGQHQ